MWLQKLEAGYHYQGILGQTYNGVHTGLSIPLWENKNTAKLQKVQLTFDNLNLQAHNTEHYSEIKRLYEKYSSLKITLEEYQAIFEDQLYFGPFVYTLHVPPPGMLNALPLRFYSLGNTPGIRAECK